MKSMPMALSREDFLSLKRAYQNLEQPSLAIRLADSIGTPIETGFKLLPVFWRKRLQRCTEHAIWKALGTAVASLENKPGTASSDMCHKLMGIATGAVGGFLGGPALLVELPFTTTIMLRSIADIARSEGENLDDIRTRLACLEVFALGGRSNRDDAADAGYYGVRMALAMSVSAASSHIARNGLAGRAGAPLLVDFVLMVSSRFGITVSEKIAAEIIPVVGAVGGALINTVFIQHFQDMARSHFTVRRLERKYGASVVQAEYHRLHNPEYGLLLAAA
ncbi:uncharacterized protein sS8_3968 [Methylocaldum marinum]|uniref:Peptidase n=1 Tax=Methylocaldum marinum TaxID=1432792 RepID=A0A250KW71_9GAMM|nr:EcsC family protein [Methylocaldum marinum]BBA35900.1 uncharacterized protein sS8_3968 [Methylocaldum marinum]